MTALVDHNRYNQLPSLEGAHEARQAEGIDDIINGPVRNVFLEHGAEAAHCLYLQHRHHRLAAGETLVKSGGSGLVWNRADIEQNEKCGNKILPATWMTTEDGMLPMECTVMRADAEPDVPSAAFVRELVSVLEDNGCAEMFGIDTKADIAWLENTKQGASYTFPNNDDAGADAAGFIPVAFAFEKDEPKFIVHGRCSSQEHRHTRPA